jgi:hypothetical protein
MKLYLIYLVDLILNKVHQFILEGQGAIDLGSKQIHNNQKLYPSYQIYDDCARFN